jgi:hypothetical protein
MANLGEMSKNVAVLVAAALTYGALPAHASDTRHITLRSVAVENVRVEPAPNSEGAPAALVKFDLLNKGLTTVREPTLRISVVEKTDAHTALAQRRVLVRPFVVRGINITLEAGQTFSYEMLLRNFSSDCNCVPYVEVLPAAASPE